MAGLGQDKAGHGRRGPAFARGQLKPAPQEEENTMLTQRIGWILWPAFLVACGSEMLFFALVDPADLHLFGEPLEASRMTIYSVGFFVFWALGAASSFLTCFLQRSPWEVNRCPLPATARPDGCPKRDESGCCN
jgi:hypothetical protein